VDISGGAFSLNTNYGTAAYARRPAWPFPAARE